MCKELQFSGLSIKLAVYFGFCSRKVERFLKLESGKKKDDESVKIPEFKTKKLNGPYLRVEFAYLKVIKAVQGDWLLLITNSPRILLKTAQFLGESGLMG